MSELREGTSSGAEREEGAARSAGAEIRRKQKAEIRKQKYVYVRGVNPPEPRAFSRAKRRRVSAEQ